MEIFTENVKRLKNYHPNDSNTPGNINTFYSLDFLTPPSFCFSLSHSGISFLKATMWMTLLTFL
jgi:hypothetical protein